jgi:phosphatidylserine/phosphatidylglycerophosphate/cardiolipin synthase-like enzyme
MTLAILSSLFLCLLVAPGCYHVWKPLPAGISFAGPPRPAHHVEFLADLTYVDPSGERRVDQRIFDEVFGIIRQARRLIVTDMFLYNDFQGDVREETRALSAELTETLLEQKRRYPEIEITVISDPINTVYGGLPSAQLDRLSEAGIQVVLTRLERLRDSNPLYSSFWRLFIRPFGNGRIGTLPNPFGGGRVSLRTYLQLLNFKANHRKVLVADAGNDYVALVTSANPHDGSSAHGNVAVRFRGAAAMDLLETERAVVEFSGGALKLEEGPTSAEPSDASIEVVTEGQIGRSLLEVIARIGPNEAIDAAVFYLSDRRVIEALREAQRRGAQVRVLLDPNKDAFGMKKNGVPNRPVAHELRKAGIPVRWCDTHGEQCHAKMMLLRPRAGPDVLVLGSANFTRRNLKDLNLETNIVVRAPRSHAVMRDARAYFELAWGNDTERKFSVAYEHYQDESWFKRMLYRISEASGIGTF